MSILLGIAKPVLAGKFYRNKESLKLIIPVLP